MKTNEKLAVQAGFYTSCFGIVSSTWSSSPVDEVDITEQLDRFAALVEQRLMEKLAQGAMEPQTAFVVTIEGDQAQMLHAMLSPALEGDEDYTPVRLMVGQGHSGRGIYAAFDDYPEEGAELLCETPVVHNTESVAQAVAAAVAQERGRCAKMAESAWLNVAERMYGQELAAAIRAGGSHAD